MVLQDRRGRVIGIEVKARRKVEAKDLTGLEQLREATGEHFHRGVILYLGDQVLPFGGFTLVPISALWEW